MDDNELLQTTDARVWAEEFVRQHGHPGADDEVGLMTGWFANAMTAGERPSLESLDEECLGEWRTLEQAVFESLGAASTCWDPDTGDAVFQSDRALRIGNNLLVFIRENGLQGETKAERAVRLMLELAAVVEDLPPGLRRLSIFNMPFVVPQTLRDEAEWVQIRMRAAQEGGQPA